MKVLITGGTGFIGTHLAKELLTEKHDVSLLDAYPNTDLLGDDVDKVEVIQGDLLDLDGLKQIIRKQGPDVIAHLAAFRNTESQQKPYGAFRLNCEGTMNVLEAARENQVVRVVYASTVAVYGAPGYYRKLGFDPYRLTEEAPPNPHNVYGVTKLCTEGMAAQYRDIYGLKSIGLRLPIILGPGKKLGSKTSLFNDVIESPLKGKPAEIESFGDQVVNLMYVKDAAHALARATLAEAPQRLVYNAGGSLCRSRDLVETVRQVLPHARLQVRDTEKERSVSSGIDSTLAAAELDYRPRFSLQDAVKDYQSELGEG